MADKHGTAIEWTHIPGTKGETWNPIRARHMTTGKRGWFCTHVSEGCRNCYAERINMKPGATGGTGVPYKPGNRENGEIHVYLDEKTLLAPLHWRAPRTIFACSMTDPFGEWVLDHYIFAILAVMAMTYDTDRLDENNVVVSFKQRHTYIVLTKRAERMRTMITDLVRAITSSGLKHHACNADQAREVGDAATSRATNDWLEHPFSRACAAISKKRGDPYWMNAPFQGLAWITEGMPGLWLGVSAENQETADERIPLLLQTPAAIRFVSCEPMLGPIDLDCPTIDWMQFPEGNGIVGGRLKFDWIICGGESGPNARPMHPDWARGLRDQCAAAGVPFFFKQNGEFQPDTLSHRKIVESSRETAWPDGTVEGGKASEHGGFGTMLHRVGKKRAGRLLDGIEHNEFPVVAA